MSHSRTHAQIEAERQAASGLAKMGLVDPSLRKKEHGPKAVAKKAQRFYNSVVHGVADKKVEQQETSNMTQSATRRLLIFLIVASMASGGEQAVGGRFFDFEPFRTPSS